MSTAVNPITVEIIRKRAHRGRRRDERDPDPLGVHPDHLRDEGLLGGVARLGAQGAGTVRRPPDLPGEPRSVHHRHRGAVRPRGLGAGRRVDHERPVCDGHSSARHDGDGADLRRLAAHRVRGLPGALARCRFQGPWRHHRLDRRVPGGTAAGADQGGGGWNAGRDHHPDDRQEQPVLPRRRRRPRRPDRLLPHRSQAAAGDLPPIRRCDGPGSPRRDLRPGREAGAGVHRGCAGRRLSSRRDHRQRRDQRPRGGRQSRGDRGRRPHGHRPERERRRLPRSRELRRHPGRRRRPRRLQAAGRSSSAGQRRIVPTTERQGAGRLAGGCQRAVPGGVVLHAAGPAHRPGGQGAVGGGTRAGRRRELRRFHGDLPQRARTRTPSSPGCTWNPPSAAGEHGTARTARTA